MNPHPSAVLLARMALSPEVLGLVRDMGFSFVYEVRDLPREDAAMVLGALTTCLIPRCVCESRQ